MTKIRVLNVFFQMAEKILRIIYIFLSTYIVATMLSVSEFGNFNLFLTFLTIGVGICQLGFENTVSLRLAKSSSKELDFKLKNTAFLIRILSTVLYFLVILFFIKWGEEAFSETYSNILIICLLLSCFNVLEYELIVKEKGINILIIRSVSYILAILTIILIKSFDLKDIIPAYLIIEFASIAILLITYTYSSSKFKFLFLSKKEIKDLLIDTFPLFISSVGIILYMRLDIIMLSTMSSSSDVGIYSLSVRFAESVNFIPVVIMTAIYPYLIKNNHSKNFKLLFDIMMNIAIISIIAIIVLFPYIIEYFFSIQYTNSIIIANILILQTIPVFLGVVRARYLVINGYQRYIPYFVFSGLFFNIIMNFFLIKYYGALGAAVATLASQIISTLFLPLMFKPLRPITKQMFISIMTLGLGFYIFIKKEHLKNKTIN